MTATTGARTDHPRRTGAPVPSARRASPTPRDPSRLHSPGGPARRLLHLRRVAMGGGTAAAAMAVVSTFASAVGRVTGVPSLSELQEVAASASGAMAWSGLALRGLARRGGRSDRALATTVLLVTTLVLLGPDPASMHLGVVARAVDALRGALGAAHQVPPTVVVLALLSAAGVALLTVSVRLAEPLFAASLLLCATSLYERAVTGGHVLLRDVLESVPPITAATGLALSIGGLAASQGRLANVLGSHRVDGVIARRFIPVVLTVPAVLGVAMSRGLRSGVVSIDEAPLLLVVPTALIGVSLVVAISGRIDRVASAAREVELRRRDEARVRLSLRRRAVLDAVTADFSKALEPAAVIRALADGPARTLGVVRLAVQWSGGDLPPTGVAGWHGRSAQVVEALLDEATITGAARFLEGRAGIVELVPHLAGNLVDEETWVILPMVVFGGCTGALALGIDGGQRLDEEERVLLSDLARRCGEALERARIHERDRELADQLRRGLTPSVAPHIGGFDLVADHRLTEADGSLGGDWYDAFPLDGGRVCVTVGDVEGRGLGAASAMGELRTALRLAATASASPSEALHCVNRALTGSVDRRMVRAVVAVFHTDGRAEVASAGMPWPLRCGSDGSVEPVAMPLALPLGVHPSSTFEDVTVPLAADQALLLHTDGVVARRGESLDLGLARLRDRLAGRGAEPAELVALAADLTGPDVESAVIAVRAAPSDAACPLRLGVSRPGDLTTARRRVRAWLEASGADRDTVDDLVLCLSEAVSNALDHGGADVTNAATVELHRTPGSWVLEVTDPGAWRPDFTHAGGRGMQIMAALTDVEVLPRADGKTVRMCRAVDDGRDTAMAGAQGGTVGALR